MAITVEPKEVVSPVDETQQPTETPVAPEEAAAPETSLSDELLQVPAIQGLLAGSPPALSAKLSESKGKVADLIKEHKDELMGAGIGFYRSLSGNVAVLFNQLYIHPEQIKAADKAGKLIAVAPPFSQVNSEISKTLPTQQPAMKNRGIPPAPAAPPPANPPQSAASPLPPPASTQRQVMAERLRNLRPQAPTQGPQAGRGDLLRSILKPVV